MKNIFTSSERKDFVLRFLLVVFLFQRVGLFLPHLPLLLHNFHVLVDERNELAERQGRLGHLLNESFETLDLGGCAGAVLAGPAILIGILPTSISHSFQLVKNKSLYRIMRIEFPLSREDLFDEFSLFAAEQFFGSTSGQIGRCLIENGRLDDAILFVIR